MDQCRERLYKDSAFLTAIPGYRHYLNHTGLEQCVGYIHAAFRATHGRVSLQPFSVHGNTYNNVICRLGPKRGPCMVIGAHYDVAGFQPGADDNASAVAGLLELVRALDQQSGSLNYGVEAVAYCLEEPPFFFTKHMGSRHHARGMRRRGEVIKEMICLEMIGYFSDQKNSQKFPLLFLKWFYPSTGNFIAVVSNFKNWSLVQQAKKDMRTGGDIEVCALNAPFLVHGVGLSDHSSYWKYNYPALMVTDTAFYRNPNYHQPSDTIETLDFDKMAQVVQAVNYHVMQQQRRGP